jgi:hypothetical protein
MNDVDLAFHIELIANAIDEHFGDGYAKSHPELVAAQLQSAAIWQLANAVSAFSEVRK